MNLEWSRPAEADLIDILDYIADDNPAAALATIDRIEATARRLIDFPHSGREGSVPDTRELPPGDLPFLIIHRVRGAVVEVLRVIHGARQWPP
jgi:plasmid stabilization system protein ParE